MTTAAERDAAVLAVLQETTHGLSPSEIAQRINQPWCCPFGACAAPVSPVLKRIGAIKLRRGVWVAPLPTINPELIPSKEKA